MKGQADSWSHQVEIEVPRAGFDLKLRVMEIWLVEWEIPYRIGSSLGSIGRLRVCFADDKFARAFHHYHGGRIIPADEVAAALAADANDEAFYDRTRAITRTEDGGAR
jgi:hypothetical protein